MTIENRFFNFARETAEALDFAIFRKQKSLGSAPFLGDHYSSES